MAITTRSRQRLRRGRSARNDSKKPSPNEGKQNRLLTQLPIPNQRRNFTESRKKKVIQFLLKAQPKPRFFGAVETDKWFGGLVKEINEPGIVLVENVKVWFSKHPDVFKTILKKHGKKSKQLKRLKKEKKERKWSITAQASDDDKATFTDSPKSVESLEDDVFEPPNVVSELNIEFPEPLQTSQKLDDLQFEVEDLTEQTVETDEVWDGELMRKLMGDDWQSNPPSPAHFGIDLTEVNPDLLTEVLEELDRYFSGVETEKIIEMVGGAEYYPTHTDSGLYTASEGSAEQLLIN